jgi:hypothetical protein
MQCSDTESTESRITEQVFRIYCDEPNQQCLRKMVRCQSRVTLRNSYGPFRLSRKLKPGLDGTTVK